MKPFITIIKSSYLQRTRSYPFLITLGITLAIAYTLVPEPGTNYSTIRIDSYVGYYNSAWIGYVTAMMTSIFLSLAGFYLVNNSITTDIKTKVGQIIASTRIHNFTYLITKVISNFLILLTITSIVFIMSIVLFFLYNEGFTFDISSFLKPYGIIVIPTMFIVSVVAVIFEILLGKYSILQNIIFFFLFSAALINSSTNQYGFNLDPFGTNIIIDNMKNTVRTISERSQEIDLSIGFILGNITSSQKFHFDGIEFPTIFILSRFIWVTISTLIILLIAPFFHRFNNKEHLFIKKSIPLINQEKYIINDLILSNLPKPKINYGILYLLKTEILLLIRKGKKWLWVVNSIGMILLAVLPLSIAHQFVVPILWFLQVHRISELVTKETYHQVHYVSFTSYKPLSRLLVSQILAGFFLMLFLVSPLIIRFLFINSITIIPIILGGLFLIGFSTVLGILTKGKKLFEILFFLLVYCNINGIPSLDYYGVFSSSFLYIAILIIIVFSLILITFLLRKQQISN